MLRVTKILKYSVLFSCAIEGVQVATMCALERFELQRGEGATVAVNPAAFEILKNELLAENVSRENVRKLAHLVAYMPEEELFIIRRR